MNRRHHRWVVRTNTVMKCVLRFCDRKGHNIRGTLNWYRRAAGEFYMVKSHHMEVGLMNSNYMEEGRCSIAIEPIDGRTVYQIRSSDDIKRVVIEQVKQAPMTTSFSTLVYHVTDVPPATREALDAVECPNDMYKYTHLASGLNNYITEFTTIE